MKLPLLEPSTNRSSRRPVVTLPLTIDASAPRTERSTCAWGAARDVCTLARCRFKDSLCPRLESGFTSPVSAYSTASTIELLPQPLSPRSTRCRPSIWRQVSGPTPRKPRRMIRTMRGPLAPILLFLAFEGFENRFGSQSTFSAQELLQSGTNARTEVLTGSYGSPECRQHGFLWTRRQRWVRTHGVVFAIHGRLVLVACRGVHLQNLVPIVVDDLHRDLPA